MARGDAKIRAAIEELARLGYPRVPAYVVAATVGVSTCSVYRYWEKEGSR